MSTYDTPETARYDTASHVEVIERGGYRDVGAQIFTWVAWALAFSFWALTMSSFFGILAALNAGAPDGVPGGAAYLTMVVGVVVLVGAALFWGMSHWSSRGRGMAVSREASTAAIYDDAERRGGDDLASRSPAARASLARDSYRPA